MFDFILDQLSAATITIHIPESDRPMLENHDRLLTFKGAKSHNDFALGQANFIGVVGEYTFDRVVVGSTDQYRERYNKIIRKPTHDGGFDLWCNLGQINAKGSRRAYGMDITEQNLATRYKKDHVIYALAVVFGYHHDTQTWDWPLRVQCMGWLWGSEFKLRFPKDHKKMPGWYYCPAKDLRPMSTLLDANNPVKPGVRRPRGFPCLAGAAG
jgi:hypothetical protein